MSVIGVKARSAFARTRRDLAAWSLLLSMTVPSIVHAQESLPTEDETASEQPSSRPSFDEALAFDVGIGFVPVANDFPLILGGAVRFLGIHEIFLRGGYMPVGDDVGYGFGVLGYRAVLLPGETIRPVLGAYGVILPATCTHDALGAPLCEPDAFFVLSAVGGVRIEPEPWIGFFVLLSLGVDSFPNPFGMIEVGTTFAIPLS